jgi:ABC-type multidrug transport system fused ATPase/permease subunit
MHPGPSAAPSEAAIRQRLDVEEIHDWRFTLRFFLPYLWPHERPDLRVRVVLALLVLVAAKGVTVTVPFLLGAAVNSLATPEGRAAGTAFALIASYGFARLMMQAFAQLRDAIFARVAFHAVQRIAGRTFRHLHALSLRFHLERRTGGLQRVIDRGTKGIDSLLGWTLFSIVPTILEFVLVCGILTWRYDVWFAVATALAIAVYAVFTITVTNWRVQYRRAMNDSDTEANTKTVDSLLNFETVKYFNNEEHEARRFDAAMALYAQASV